MHLPASPALTAVAFRVWLRATPRRVDVEALRLRDRERALERWQKNVKESDIECSGAKESDAQ